MSDQFIPFTSRRSFLKNAALVGSGIAVSPLISSANYFHAGSDVIKVALIGCGGRGTGAAIQALLSGQNVAIVAMADAFRDRIDNCYKEMLSDENGDAEALKTIKKGLVVKEENKFTGFDAYLKAIPLADVVILTTPPGFRPIHFEEAIQQGKHVFMEKPVATDPAGVQKVLATAAIAKQKKLNVVVGLQRHYQNQYIELFNRKDQIGDIVTAQAWWNNDGVWVHPRKAGQTEMEYQMRNWYYFNWLCGDHITEQHIHNIDVINWFKGGYPIKAYGMGGREVRKGKDHGEIFDHHCVTFEYADGTLLNSQCRHIPGTMSRVDELLVGTKGSIQCDAGTIVDRKGNIIYQFNKQLNGNNPYQTEHDMLFAAIAKGVYQFADAENAAKSTMTSILGRMATYSGQLIEWDKAIRSGISLAPKVFDFNALPPILPDANGFYPVAIPGVTKF